MPATHDLAYWITQRELMRHRREYGDAGFKYGYHDDPAMGLVRYCNVRREDDKVTRWLAEHWRPMWNDKIYMMVLARMLNYIPTLELIAKEKCTKSSFIEDMLKAARKDGRKIFTSAYTISTCGQSMDKIDYVMGVVDACREVSWTADDLNSLAHAHRTLMKVNGLGSFLAAQVLADLKNTEGHPMMHAVDWQDWSAPGPGSLRGLSAFWAENVTPAQYHFKLRETWDLVQPALSEDLHDLHMQDFQNCLCEFSKYMRVKEGGHARNRYRPGQD